MRAIAMVGRSELRRRVGRVLTLGLTIALGLGAALGAFIGAYRTDHAYPDHVARARVADVVVNPSLTSPDSDSVIRSLPHVRHVSTHTLMFAGYFEPGRTYTLREILAENGGFLYASPDGSYLRTDRLIVEEGTRPAGSREVFVTDGYRDKLAKQVGHPLHVGDRIPIGFAWSGLSVPPSEEALGEAVHPIATPTLRISGFGRLADAVLDDPLFPREELVVSPDIARRFSCPPTPVPPVPDRDALLHALFPPDCSVLYRYYSLQLDDPAQGTAVARLAQQRLNALNGPLQQRVGDLANEVGYYPVITTHREDSVRIRHAIRPTVVALRIFGWVALLATLVVLALAAARLMRDQHETDTIVRALGGSRASRVAIRVLPSAVGAFVGLLGALVVGVLLSPIGPVGEVARVEPHRSLAAPAAVLVPFGLGATAALAITLAAIGGLTTQSRPRLARRSLADRLRQSLRPDVADGVTAALGGGRAALLPAAAAVAISAVVVAAVFGSNVGTLVEHPQHFGWPWQVGVLTGAGYGDTNTKAVRSTLEGRPEVRSWDWLATTSGTVAGRPVTVLSAARPIDLPVVRGRAPRRPGEAALGRTTAANLGIRIGSKVRIDSEAGPRPVRIVGLMTLPAIGQFLSDRTGLGVGAFMLVPAQELSGSVTFTGIHLARGADPDALLRAIRGRLPSWDNSGSAPLRYAAAVRPPEIVNADAMRAAPTALAGLLALALLAAITLSMGSTVNGRRHEYAVYRALGFEKAQVARSVRWQALTTIGIGLVVGVPLGIASGRVLWRRFAEQLGIASAIEIPSMLLATTAVGAVLGALAVAVIPARRAANRSPAAALSAH